LDLSQIFMLCPGSPRRPFPDLLYCIETHWRRTRKPAYLAIQYDFAPFYSVKISTKLEERRIPGLAKGQRKHPVHAPSAKETA
jgi:hypothetical protein